MLGDIHRKHYHNKAGHEHCKRHAPWMPYLCDRTLTQEVIMSQEEGCQRCASPTQTQMRMNSWQSLHLSPAIDGIICHDYNILQLVPIEVHSLEWQDWLSLQL